MENEKAVLQLLGLSARAGKIASGEFQCEEALMRRQARVVFVSGDASGNTCKKFINKCTWYQVPCYQLEADKELLGRCIGKGARSCAAVTDEGLGKAIIAKIMTDRKVENSL